MSPNKEGREGALDMTFSGFRGYIVLITISIISLLLISCEKSEDFNEKLKDESTALPVIEQGQA